jgi:hypothetical protein
VAQPLVFAHYPFHTALSRAPEKLALQYDTDHYRLLQLYLYYTYIMDVNWNFSAEQAGF